MIDFGQTRREAEALDRHRAFWRDEIVDRPLVLALAAGNQQGPDWSPHGSRKEWDLNPQWHRSRAQAYLAENVFVADSLPLVSLMVGLDITHNAVLAGGDYHYASGGQCLGYTRGRFALDRPIPPFAPETGWIKALEECYRVVLAEVGSQAAVNGTMTLDPLSSLFSLQEPTEFLLEMARGSSRIQQRRRELTQSYLAFYEHFYSLLRDNGHGITGSWLQMYVEGRFESVRCDFSLLLSPELFGEYVVTQLEEICLHMDRTLFNMSSVEHHRFIPQLAAVPGLDGVFWNPEPWRGRVADHLPWLRQIRELGMRLEIVCYTLEDALVAAKNLGGQGVALLLVERFPQAADAALALREIAAACRLLRKTIKRGSKK